MIWKGRGGGISRCIWNVSTYSSIKHLFSKVSSSHITTYSSPILLHDTIIVNSVEIDTYVMKHSFCAFSLMKIDKCSNFVRMMWSNYNYTQPLSFPRWILAHDGINENIYTMYFQPIMQERRCYPGYCNFFQWQNFELLPERRFILNLHTPVTWFRYFRCKWFVSVCPLWILKRDTV